MRLHISPKNSRPEGHLSFCLDLINVFLGTVLQTLYSSSTGPPWSHSCLNPELQCLWWGSTVTECSSSERLLPRLPLSAYRTSVIWSQTLSSGYAAEITWLWAFLGLVDYVFPGWLRNLPPSFCSPLPDLAVHNLAHSHYHQDPGLKREIGKVTEMGKFRESEVE